MWLGFIWALEKLTYLFGAVFSGILTRKYICFFFEVAAFGQNLHGNFEGTDFQPTKKTPPLQGFPEAKSVFFYRQEACDFPQLKE